MTRTSITMVLAFALTAGIAFTQGDGKVGVPPSKDHGDVYRVGAGVSPPVPIYNPEPEYSEEACKAKYQGSSALQVVVNEKGAPIEIRVVRKLGLGLDERAIEAVSKWRFKPGTKDDKPVSVMVTIEVGFRPPSGKKSC